MTKHCLLAILLFSTVFSFSQKKEKTYARYGMGVFYNFQTEGLGVNVRSAIPVQKKLFIVPYFTYFPNFNIIHEYYLGADINYFVFSHATLKPYILAGGYYDNWINSTDFANSKVKKNNFIFQCGGGVVLKKGCVNPFIEYRYDTKWKEGLLGVGLYFIFQNCKNKGKKTPCPAFS